MRVTARRRDRMRADALSSGRAGRPSETQKAQADAAAQQEVGEERVLGRQSESGRESFDLAMRNP